jgi:hypothetical protein
MQSGGVFGLLLSERQQVKQPVEVKPGLEDSLHEDIRHTVTLFKQLVYDLAVSWFYSARNSKYRRLSDKKFIGPLFITHCVVNFYY